MTELTIEVIESLDRLPLRLRQEWLTHEGASFFLTLPWFETLASSGLDRNLTVRLYAVRDGSRYVAVLPCCRSRNDRALRSLTNFYSNGYSLVVLADATMAAPAAEALARHIAHERPRWTTIDLQFFVDSDPNTIALREALARAGFKVYSYFQYENWYSDTRGVDFAQYFSNRPSQLRNTILRKERKLRREHAVDLRIYRHLDSSTQLADATGQFIEVYNGSWKRPEPFPNFLPTLIRSTNARRQLRLGILKIDDMPAAAQIWIFEGKRMLIYKLAYAERFKDLSVGSILSTELFRMALDEDRAEELDYGVGSDAYKRDWVEKRRNFIGIIAFNPLTTSGLAKFAVHAAGRMRRAFSDSTPTADHD